MTARRRRIRPKSGKKYLAVDKKGHVISNREELIRHTEERMKSGSSLCLLRPRSRSRREIGQGGFMIAPDDDYQLALDGKLLSDVHLDLVVPADPEFKEHADKEPSPTEVRILRIDEAEPRA